MRIAMTLIGAILALNACSALNPVPTITPSATATLTATPIPSDTPSPTATATSPPSATPTPSPTPTSSPTPTETPIPSATPHPAPGFIYDNWGNPDIPQSIRDGIDNPLVAILNSNDRQTIRNRATAQPGTGIQTLYFVPPNSPAARAEILRAESARPLDVYLAPRGNALAYVKRDGEPRDDGLYLLDLAARFSARVLAGANPLAQRGMYLAPQWSPDGSQLAIALETGYALDIFLYALDGSGRSNLTQSDAFELYPRFSPDGRYLSFVSDREACPSWRPGIRGACDASMRPPPGPGLAYVMDLTNGETRRISDTPVSEAPYWINERQLAFATGDNMNLLNPQRRIWKADVISGEARRVDYSGAASNASYLAEAWSPLGDRVLLQIADLRNQVALLSDAGALLALDADLSFPRFGLSAAWSPEGQLLVIGGTAGQCPFGIRIKNADYESQISPNPPPSMCDPVFSPDGSRIAFSGVDSSRSDGRRDVYAVRANGYGRSNLTSSLYGAVELLGWVGGSP